MAAEASSRKPMVGGNFKCNLTVSGLTELCKGLKALSFKNVDVVVAPVALHLSCAMEQLKGSNIEVSCQNVSATGQGAFTGEISADQLKDFGIKYTIIGHSERRSKYGETDAIVTTKVKAALAQGLHVIACLGETQEQRDAGKVKDVCLAQLKAIVAGIEKEQWSRVVIAYEPVWAIGTGNTCSPKDAQEVCAMLRAELSSCVSADTGKATRVIYGGSVKPKNAASLIEQADIDGFLVGGASLKADLFGPIIAAADK